MSKCTPSRLLLCFLLVVASNAFSQKTAEKEVWNTGQDFSFRIEKLADGVFEVVITPRHLVAELQMLQYGFACEVSPESSQKLTDRYLSDETGDLLVWDNSLEQRKAQLNALKGTKQVINYALNTSADRLTKELPHSSTLGYNSSNQLMYRITFSAKNRFKLKLKTGSYRLASNRNYSPVHHPEKFLALVDFSRESLLRFKFEEE